jgi:predicted metalloprotease with PDZ domain
MMIRKIFSLFAVGLAAVALAADEPQQQKCTSSAQECELQIRQMLAGKTYLGVKLAQSRWGLVVTSVADQSPAKDGGLRPEDRIFAINGKNCSKADVAEFKRLIGQVRGNKTINLTIVRAGQVRRVYLRPQHLSREQVDKVVSTHLKQAHAVGQPSETHASGAH